MEIALYIMFLCILGIHGMSIDSANETAWGSDDLAPYNGSLGETSLEFTPAQYYMNRMCNQKRLLRDRNAILMAPWSNRLPPTTQNCKVGIESTTYTTYRFVVTFKKMAMSSATVGNCERSRLDLYNGISESVSDRISGGSGICGRSTSSRSYETTTNFLTMLYTTKNLPSGSSEFFEAVITPFHYGTCLHDEFKCANHKCVQKNMLCDGYNNCGDDSDEKHCAGLILSVAAIIGIVLGAIVLIVAIVVVCVCCNLCCCACSAYDRF